MAKIIAISNGTAVIGMDGGEYTEVQVSGLEFEPKLGEEVEIYNNDERTIVVKKAWNADSFSYNNTANVNFGYDDGRMNMNGGCGDMEMNANGGYGDMGMNANGGYGDMGMNANGGYGDMGMNANGGYDNRGVNVNPGMRAAGAKRVESGRPMAGKKAVKKTTYCLLALFLGWFGVHKFYAGKIGWGIVYLIFSATWIPLIVALIEFVIALCQTPDEYGRIYV